MQQPLFVIGVPRSGTSLLYGLLNQHPQIALLYEGDLPLLRPLFLKRRSKEDWLRRWNFWNGSIERHKIDVGPIPSAVVDTREATESAYQQYARQKGAVIWGCKSADQYDLLPQLAKLFPHARFLVVWRDPADVCRSVIRARTMSSPRFRQRGVVHRTLFGCYHMAKQCEWLKKRGFAVHELRYECLLKNPVEELSSVCRFLGIIYDAQMESLENSDRSALHPGEHNSLAAGDKIVAHRKQEEVLPAKLKIKIDKYTNLWHAKHPEWFLGTYADGESDGKPNLFSRFRDRALYQLLRIRDFGVIVAYCYVPMRLLEAYRILNGHYYLTWQEYARGCTDRSRPWLGKS
jgi:hypothetical protein